MSCEEMPKESFGSGEKSAPLNFIHAPAGRIREGPSLSFSFSLALPSAFSPGCFLPGGPQIHCPQFVIPLEISSH